ncbi:MAG: DUF4422 domain-containing protein [Lachnospiraceae bacterium]|jgi:hypothetical protein|nr:DUF4422 domain-containing protein [Lachnospiraceae bacterium]MCH4030048.1 DUF4422 domain-containing protein [Lachnospiraceae bacterium]MCH4070292.1 DUF4422 domain-containing protein [Lachnospiraceae bacterium]MCH4107804.1 DUF4422 domain-containing protein [Lachnospiraceae bacterium]MCI1361499.1 DUF4422 domain-containing protein [Lachnospiraceae bacterium]
MNVKILIAAHKKYKMPSDSMYIPIRVGAAGARIVNGRSEDFGYVRDDTGENISSKNPEFSELTAVYWAWKNLSADYIGMVHYRRYFSVSKKGKNPFDNIMTITEAEKILKDHVIIVPQKRHYFIESLYSHYANSLEGNHLVLTKQIIHDKCPEYLQTYDKVMKRTWGYMFNMMVMRSDYYDAYCKWLFDILFELEKKIDLRGYTPFERRLFGRVSELLFDVWLEFQIEQGIIAQNQIQEVPIISMEPVNWLKKGSAFLAAKLFHKKYKKSF